MVANYETVSPIYIYANTGPVVLKGNNFLENIGTSGGAVHISSPRFEQSMPNEAGVAQVNGQAFVVMANNIFERNMAYFAGNALYIRPTMTIVEDYIDYR